MLRELTSLSLNINHDTLVLSSVSEADPVTGGPAYKLSPSLLLGSHIWTMGEPVITLRAGGSRMHYPSLSPREWYRGTKLRPGQVQLTVQQTTSDLALWHWQSGTG